ncbi:MFS transporter [Gammaproteobacteria bacterium 45_16_T64]|nr:MFS transporter [Gammaproteobacteria bacterium 45_16_T64]
MSNEHQERSQFYLFKQRRFAPLFYTQFLGAFNDNVFKSALMILVAFSASYTVSVETNTINNIASMLFILPFFLFSALAGELADKYEKDMLIRRIKLFEIVIMIGASIAFYFNHVVGLLILLFCTGVQSAFFAPIKYSIIPQHLKSEELIGGNALIESGTFLAILFGTILGGLLSKLDDGPLFISFAIILVAVLGWLSSTKIPYAAPSSPDLNIKFNPLTETWKTLKIGREIRSVQLASMSISWFWCLGASYLTQLPNYTKTVLNGDQTVVTLLLALFSIGIATGSLLCEKLSSHKVELGLVPLGSIGLTLFGMDLSFSHTLSVNTIGVMEFVSVPANYRLIFDFIMIGVSGGLYIVPLYAMIQERTPEEKRSRTIAAVNILNAVFIVVSALFAVFFLSYMELSIPQFFMVIAIMNAVVALYIYRTIPEFFMRFIIWIITHTMYRVKHSELNNIPDEGAAVLVCNHVSYMDAMIIAGACRRPVRFVMFKPIYHLPVLNFVFRTAKAIPIHSRSADPETYEAAFKQISVELSEEEVVCIFPEGKLTTDGEIDEFKNGIEKILKQNPVPVIPMALKGLWGSFFSHKDGNALTSLPSRFWSRVELTAATPIPAVEASAVALEKAVRELRGSVR